MNRARDEEGVVLLLVLVLVVVAISTAYAMSKTAMIEVISTRQYGQHARATLLARSGEVRHDAEHPLDEEELRAMVHLVFLHAEQDLEPLLAAIGKRDELVKLRLGDAVEPDGKSVAARFQRLDNLRLRRQGRCHLGGVTHIAAEVLHRDRAFLFDEVNLLGPMGRRGDVREYFGHAHGAFRRLEAVLLSRNIFGHLDRVLAHRTPALCHLFCAVTGPPGWCCSPGWLSPAGWAWFCIRRRSRLTANGFSPEP